MQDLLLENSKEKKVQFCYYALAFVDILSQKNELRRLSDLPDNEASTGEFIEALHRTFGTVRAFRSFFDVFVESSRSFSVDTTTLTDEQQQRLDELRRDDIQFRRISDAMIISVPLARPMPTPMNSVYMMLVTCAGAMLTSLAAGQAVRGGIDIGVGADIGEGEIYGSALSRAYLLESSVAEYPRIVVGGNILEYLQLHASDRSPSDEAVIASRLAQKCQTLLYADEDGRLTVNYLGAGFRAIMGEELARKMANDIVPDAYNFVVQEQLKFRTKQDSKLAFRYNLLKSYFDKHLPDWQSLMS